MVGVRGSHRTSAGAVNTHYHGRLGTVTALKHEEEKLQNNSQQSAPSHPAIRQFGEDEFTNLRDSKTKQHNIMLLVGNGFDIAVLDMLGADYKTDYQSFYYYLKSRKFDGSNTIFKKMDELRLKHEASKGQGSTGFSNWSDLESVLQEFVSNSRGVDFDRLHADLEVIQDQFSNYLDLVVQPSHLTELSALAQSRRWAYSTFSRFLADLDEDSYLKLEFPRCTRYYDLFNFNIINFNYTYLLDNYLFLDQKQFNPHPYLTVDTNFLFRLNPRNHGGDKYRPNADTGCSSYLFVDLHHPHGAQAIPRSLLFGIDSTDKSAAQGSSHGLDKAFWAQTPRRYKKMIAESELFIIFGSSIGRTDRWWWRHILKRIDDGGELIIYKFRSDDGSDIGALRQKIAEQFVEENYDPTLFGGAEMTNEQVSRMMRRIHVVLYSDSATLSALGFSPSVFEPGDKDPASIPKVR